MKTVLKFIAGLIALAALALLVVINFSEVKTNFVCDGELNRKGKAVPEKAFLELSEYRWWVHLWNASYGNLKAQLDNDVWSTYAPKVDRIGDGALATYMFWNYEANKLLGGLRAANGALTLNLADEVVFTGKCRPR